MFRRGPDHFPRRAGGQKAFGNGGPVRARLRLHGPLAVELAAVHEARGGHVDVGRKFCVFSLLLSILSICQIATR